MFCHIEIDLKVESKSEIFESKMFETFLSIGPELIEKIGNFQLSFIKG